MSGESSRPWEPTHEEVEEHGVWADYAAFGRWWQDAVEETLCEGEASIWDGMGTIQQTHMYVVLSSLFDARPPGPATGFSSVAADRVDEQAAHIGSLEATAPEQWQAVLGTARYWLRRAAQTIRDREDAARTPGPAPDVARLTWTAERPTVPGWYWMRCPLVKASFTGHYSPGDADYYIGYEFAGPIPEPPDATAKGAAS